MPFRHSRRRSLSEIASSFLASGSGRYDNLDTVAFVPAVSPHYEAPEHLRPYAELLDSAIGSNLRQVVAAPPQHGKTVVTSHALVRWALLGRAHYAYATYSQDRSDEVSRQTWEIAQAAGLEPEGRTRLWRVKTGAEFKFTSIGGSLTGYPLDGGLVIDDPIKDRAEAESLKKREAAWSWWTDVGRTRLHPGAFVILMATRWHIDDLSGRCIEREKWPYLNLRAIADGGKDPLGRAPGQALWPHHRPVDFLRAAQSNEYTWASLYQGDPRPRGGKLFREPTWYDELPTEGYRIGHGVDLAYTAKRRSDYSVCVTLLRHRVPSTDSEPARTLLYVVDVQRMQVEAPRFAAVLKRQREKWPGSMLWRGSGTEKGSADFIRGAGVPLTILRPPGDKFVCALDTAASWNEGRILLPRSASARQWVEPLVREVTQFTGVNDPNDDQVDALASGHDLLSADFSAGAATGAQRAVN